MERISLNIVLFLFCLGSHCTMLSQHQGLPNIPTAPTIDPLKVTENTPTSPETAKLGEFGNIGATSYNGKANINVPIYSIPFEDLQIPINLSYDSGGILVNSEASWVGLNWSLSTNYGVSRKVYGLEDLSAIGNPGNGYVFNNLLPLILNEGQSLPTHDFDDIFNVHYSYNISPVGRDKPQYLDTQPDVFTLNAVGQSYRFILKKKGSSHILDTYVFNNNNVKITYNLNSEVFTLIDDNGYTFYFGSKEFSTSFHTIQNSGSTPPSSFESAALNVFADTNETNVGTITSWMLDSIVAPNGRDLTFSYRQGLHFTFPTYSFSHSLGLETSSNLSVNSGGYRLEQPNSVGHQVSLSVVENLYLEQIQGDFGKVIFKLDGRIDLCTGSSIDHLLNNYYGLNVLKTANNHIRNCHGTNIDCGTQTDLLPLKLYAIEVENMLGNKILNVHLEQSYFDQDLSAASDRERFLRLKLDGLSINDQSYSFTYKKPNGLPAKDSHGVDFWGYANGMEYVNNHKIPRIGRFTTERPALPEGWSELQNVYVDVLGGANRSSNFNFGENGLLQLIKYPTKGMTHLEYEPHEIVLSVPPKFQVTQNHFPQSAYFKWTNMRDEALFNPTYQFLKYAKDPNYSFFYKTDPVIQGNPVITNHLMNDVIVVTNPSILEFDALVKTQTNYSGMTYWANHDRVVVLDINSGNEISVVKYSDATYYSEDPARSVTKNIVLPPGEYRVIDRIANVPQGQNHSSFPGIPAISINPYQIKLLSFETLPDSQLAQFVERFEIGGARLKRITNRDATGKPLKSKEYHYVHPNGLSGYDSSGILMDELVFYSKNAGFYSYDPTNGNTLISSENVLGHNPTAQGSHIGYTNVKEFDIDGELTIGHKSTLYFNQKNEYFRQTFEKTYLWTTNQNMEIIVNGVSMTIPTAIGNYGKAFIQNTLVLGLPPRASHEYENGNIINDKIYNDQGNLIKESQFEYTILGGDVPDLYFSSFIPYSLNIVPSNDNLGQTRMFKNTTDGPWGSSHDTYYPYQFPKHLGYSSKILSARTIDYFDDRDLVIDNSSTYDPIKHHLKQEQRTDSEGVIHESQYLYPYDTEVVGETGMSSLVSENRIAKPVMSKMFKDAEMLYSQKINYASNTLTKNKTRPVKVDLVKGDESENLLEDRLLYERYDQKGNVLQYKKPNGITISLIYGYKQTYVVAKIENAHYSQIEALSGFETEFNLEDGGLNTFQENTLRTALPNSMITTYTYDPLIGVTSVTDPKGKRLYYIYDEFNRLKEVKDQDGNLVSDYKYHYKGQPNN